MATVIPSTLGSPKFKPQQMKRHIQSTEVVIAPSRIISFFPTIDTYADRSLVPGLEKQTLRVRLFEKKITTFDIGTKQMLEFQNLLKSTITFCVIHVVCTSKWVLRPRKSQRMVHFSKWHAYKFSLRTQTQPSSMHQLDVKNTPHHRHQHATTNYVKKWVGFN